MLHNVCPLSLHTPHTCLHTANLCMCALQLPLRLQHIIRYAMALLLEPQTAKDAESATALSAVTTTTAEGLQVRDSLRLKCLLPLCFTVEN